MIVHIVCTVLTMMDMTKKQAEDFRILFDLENIDDDFEDIEQYCAIDEQIEAIKRGYL